MRPSQVLPSALFLLASVTPALAAADPACERFGLRGLLPGMTSRDVAREMGSKGDEVRVEAGENGSASSATYHGWPAAVTVLYDRVLGKGEATVVEVRMALPDRLDRAPRELLAVLDKLGHPVAGQENLESGLVNGSTSWVERACNILVTARREEENWWEGSRRMNVLVARRLDAACTDAETSDLKEICAAPVPAPSAPALVAAAAPPVAAAQEPPAPEPPGPERSDPEAGNARSTAPIREVYVAPRYPEAMRRSHVSARVRILLTVEPDGSVGDVKVLAVDPPGKGFERSAVEAARRWRYRPATRAGKPVRDTATVDVKFE